MLCSLEDPAPAVAVAGLADSAVMVNVRPWARSADYWAVYSATLQGVTHQHTSTQ